MDTAKVYHAGTLTYRNLRQLLVACSCVMGARLALLLVASCLVPLLQPLLMDRAGASTLQIAIIGSTLCSILNTILCPVISTVSDKTRTRWGRRTPYLIISAPLLAGILILIGYAKEISAALLAVFPGFSGNMHLWVLGVLIILFQIAFLFPGCIVYYLEADIVPRECFGRYMAFASILSTIATAGFGYFITQYINDHCTLIIWVFAVCYVAIYLLQALFAKEGEYPPVKDKLTHGGSKLRHSFEYCVMFFRQCFSCKIYIALALCSGLNSASNACRGMYNLLFATKELGVSLELFGKITATGGIISAALIYFAGKLMDKTHPMLIYFCGGVLVIFVNVFGYFFAIGPKSYAVIAVITVLVYSFQSLAGIPMLASIYPKEKFGQFCSANAMVTHLVMIGATAFGGVVTQLCGYRVMFVWDFVVTIFAMSALGIVYQQWKRFGGKNYQAPNVD